MHEIVYDAANPRFRPVVKFYIVCLCLIGIGTIAVAVPLLRPSVQFWLSQLNGGKVYPLPSGGDWYAKLLASHSSPDGRWVVTAQRVPRHDLRNTYETELTLWDAASETKRWSLTLKARRIGIDREANHIFWSPDSKTMITTDNWSVASFINASSGKLVKTVDSVDGYSTSSTKSSIYFSNIFSDLKQIDKYDWSNLNLVETFNYKNRDFAVSANDRYFSTIDYINIRNISIITNYRKSSDQYQKIGEVDGNSSAIFSDVYHPSSNLLAIGFDNGEVSLLDIDHNRYIWRLPSYGDGRGDLVIGLSWNPSGTALVASSFGSCGWLRSNCISVIWPGKDLAHPQRRVVWNRNSYLRAATWINDDTLLINDGDKAFTLKVKPPAVPN